MNRKIISVESNHFPRISPKWEHRLTVAEQINNLVIVKQVYDACIKVINSSGEYCFTALDLAVKRDQSHLAIFLINNKHPRASQKNKAHSSFHISNEDSHDMGSFSIFQSREVYENPLIFSILEQNNPDNMIRTMLKFHINKEILAEIITSFPVFPKNLSYDLALEIFGEQELCFLFETAIEDGRKKVRKR
ncbi:MAG: hypothetical protein HRT90_05040 [Candidatus Margulisbacteria bacterium]|nr:hypothetical protein [Candidatus Margulisiibacteriota bacterium]